MLKHLDNLQPGYNPVTAMADPATGHMLMDIGLLRLQPGEDVHFCEAGKESAFLLLTGTVEICWEGQQRRMTRQSIFDEAPSCLHVPAGVSVTVAAVSEAEVVVQATDNPRSFASRFYGPEDCRNETFGAGVWGDTANRTVRTVFDYSNAPYSSLVIGEVITHPGKWSSYPPHHHPQPEVYLYKFNKPQGFGCSIIGDDVYKVAHNSFAMIPGGLVHPQTAAPGYAMYYCWMIRHLDGNPWTDRINEPCHTWLLADNVKIWPEQE